MQAEQLFLLAVIFVPFFGVNKKRKDDMNVD